MPACRPRAHAALCRDAQSAGQAYLFGGSMQDEAGHVRHSVYRDVFRLRLAPGDGRFRWRALQAQGPPPGATEGVAMCALPATLYIFGGFNREVGTRRRRPRRCPARLPAAAPPRRSVPPPWMAPGAVAAPAPASPPCSQRRCLSGELHTLDLASRAWSRLATKGPSPAPRRQACLASVGASSLVLCGGLLQQHVVAAAE